MFANCPWNRCWRTEAECMSMCVVGFKLRLRVACLVCVCVCGEKGMLRGMNMRAASKVPCPLVASGVAECTPRPRRERPRRRHSER